MTLTLAENQQLITEHQVFMSAIQNGQTSLNAVIAAGTALYNDPKYSVTFGAIAGYTAYLTACQTAINTLFSSWPTEPPNISW